MRIVWQAGAPRVEGPDAAEDFGFSVVQQPREISPAEGTATVNDVIYTAHTWAGIDNDFRILVTDSPLRPGHDLVNRTPEVCAVDADGSVRRLRDGTADVAIATRIGTRLYSQDLYRAPGGFRITGVQSPVPGSLLAYLTDQTDAICAAATPGAAAQRAFVNPDGTGGPNPDLMLRQAAPGFTPLATGLDAILDGMPLHWLTPHHQISTAHVLGVGPLSDYYRNLDGSPVMAATPTTQVKVSGNGVVAYGRWLRVIGDVAILYSPSPYGGGGGTIRKLLPAGWRAWLPTFSRQVPVPVWCRRYWSSDADDHYWVQPLDMVDNGLNLVAVPQSPLRRGFYRTAPNGGTPLTGGDSGSPFFLGIHGEAVLLGCASTTTSAANYADISPQIDAAMRSLAQAAGDPGWAGYGVTTVELGGFPDYDV